MDLGDDDRNAPGGMRWMPTAEAAQALGIGERTMRRRVAAGGFRSRRVRGKAYILVPVADDWRPEPMAGVATLRRRLEALDVTAACLGTRLDALEAAARGAESNGRRLERLAIRTRRSVGDGSRHTQPRRTRPSTSRETELCSIPNRDRSAL